MAKSIIKMATFLSSGPRNRGRAKTINGVTTVCSFIKSCRRGRIPCLGLRDQTCGSGLWSHPLPLVVGHNSRVGTLSFTPTAQGAGWVADLWFQRQR